MATKKPVLKRRKVSKKTSLKQKLLILKTKLKNKFELLKNKVFKYLKFLSLIVVLALGALSFIYVSVKSPEWHEDYLTAKMGKNVVVLTGFNNFNSGGTGFQMQTKDGLKLISNAHVCSIGLETGYLLAHNGKKQEIVKILKIDPVADLCMLTMVSDVPGLKLGLKPKFGDTVGILGHPLLQPQTFSKGRILAQQLIPVAVGYYNEKTCVGPGAQKLDSWFGAFCVRLFMSYYTNAIIFPGNSGSPAVNFFGNVVGVVFAGNTRTNYGHLVTYEDLKRFINE